MDRIDLIVEMPAVKISDLSAPASGEPSAEVRERVIAARARQQARLDTARSEAKSQIGSDVLTNADIGGELIDTLLLLSAENKDLAAHMAEKFSLTARGYHRLLRVARTIADLAGAEAIERQHLLEASAYRRFRPS